jgi:hypothetical protein
MLAAALLAAPGTGRAQQQPPQPPQAPQAQSRPEVTEEFHRTYALAPSGRISLANIRGKVRVTGWDRSEVRVDAVKRAYAPERLAEAQIKVDADQNYIRIETVYPDGPVYHGGQQSPGRNMASVDFTLSVPRGARLEDINIVSGPLDIEGVGGAVRASVVNGRVTARALSGPVKLSVVNGRLDAGFDRLSASNPVSLGSVSGPLVLTIPSDSNAIIKAGTVSGPISNDFRLPVREGGYVGRNLAGRLGSGGARITLNNVSGPIAIRRAADGRQLSPSTNLLSEIRSDKEDSDKDVDNDAAADSVEEIKKERARAAREAQLEERRERIAEERASRRDRQPPAARATAKAATDERITADRERREALREVQREARREARLSQQEIERISREAARHATLDDERATRKTQKETGKSVVVDNTQRKIERESNTMQTSGVPRIRLETFGGPVTVHGWDKAEVSYTIVKRAFDEKELKGIKINTRSSNSRRTDTTAGTSASSSEVLIRAEFDKTFAHDVEARGGRIVSFTSNASAELDVYVPRNSILSVSSGDGRVRVETVNGEMDLHTGDGPVDVMGSRGRLKIVTGDGRIRVEGFDGDADARTGDGRITLDGRFIQLAARTGEGTISLTLPEGSNALVETTAASVVNDGVAVAEDSGETQQRVRRWRIGGGGNLFTLRTGSGQVILRRR